MMIGGPQEAEAHGEHPGHAAGPEGDLEGGGQGAGLGCGRRADVALGGQRHADEAGEARHDAAGQEGQGAVEAGLEEGQRLRPVRLGDRHRRQEDDDRQRDQDDGDGLELAPEVGLRPLLDRLGDLDHLGGALVGGHDALGEDETDGDGQERGHAGEQQDELVTRVEGELLVSPFAGEEEERVHACSTSFRSRQGRA